MEDRTKLLIAVIVLALILVGGGTCMCGGLGWMAASTPQYDVSAERAQADGERDGRAGSSDDCLRSGHSRELACDALGFDCQNLAMEYLRACLRAVPTPDPQLCVGAPAHAGFLSDPVFTRTLCGRFGWAEESSGCTLVATCVETHCEARGR